MDYRDMEVARKGESSQVIRARVKKARKIQMERYKEERIYFNAGLSSGMVEKYCKIDKEGGELIAKAFEKETLSARGYHKIIKVARTIADLDESEAIQPKHLAESIYYRIADKKYWN